MTKENSLKVQRKNRLKKQRILIISVLAVLTAVLAIMSFTGKDAGPQAKELKGTWVFSENTSYSFNGRGKGTLYLTDLKFEFTYRAGDGKLSIDFTDDTLQDCAYSITINGDILTLTGGEGTSGGEYVLTRKK